MDTPSRSPSELKPPALGEFLEEQISVRLRRLAYELRNTRHSMDEERVHDLRVAVRRLLETIRVMEPVLPREGAKDVRKALRKIMNAAGQVRSCDIAAGLIEKAGAPSSDPAVKALKAMRADAEAGLYERAHQAYQRSATQKWRSALLPASQRRAR